MIQVLPHVDGHNYVKSIAENADVDLAVVEVLNTYSNNNLELSFFQRKPEPCTALRIAYNISCATDMYN